MEESNPATDDAEIQRRIEARKAEIREWDAKRKAAGLYFPSEAADELAAQRAPEQRSQWARNFLEGWKSGNREVKGLLSAAKDGKVTVFDPVTWLPVKITTESAALALFVTRDGVNKWLEETSALYRWEAAATIEPSGASTAPEVSEDESTAAASSASPQRNDIEKSALTTAVVIRKRRALILEVQDIWPSIERDLRDANRNKLHAAAKHKRHGFWKLGPALKWATEQGKLDQRKAKTRLDASDDSELSLILRQLIKS